MSAGQPTKSALPLIGIGSGILLAIVAVAMFALWPRDARLVVETPAEDQVVAAGPIDVRGTVDRDTVTEVLVNGVAATLAVGEWQARLPAAPELRVEARHDGDVLGSVLRGLTVDDTPPSIQVDGDLVRIVTSAEFELSGTVLDEHLPETIEINGEPHPLDGDRYHVTVPLVEGPNRIDLRCVDRGGNFGTARITATLDSVAPKLYLAEIPPTWGAERVAVSGHVDERQATVQVNGTRVHLQAGRFDAPVALSGDAPTIEVIATDAAGNTDREEIQVDHRPRVVALDGSGDWTSLVRAVRAAPPGGVIHVRPGTYVRPPALRSPVTIIGDGPREEIILRAEDDHAIHAQSSGVVLRGLTLLGTDGGFEVVMSGVYVEAGDATLEDCVIVTRVGSGVTAIGSSVKLTMRDCLIRDNRYAGLHIDGATVDIEDCEITRNEMHGVHFGRGATGTIRSCRITQNAHCGVVVSERSAATVSECRVAENGHSGVTTDEDGTVTVESSSSDRNERHGYCALNDSTFVLTDCSADENKQSGVRVYGDARVQATDCEFTKNVECGAHISGGAENNLTRVTATGSGWSGILYADEASGTIDDCTSSNNEQCGLFVAGKAAPSVNRLVVSDSGYSGIHISDEARGTFIDCRSSNSKRSGFSVNGSARPTFTNCHSEGNTKHGFRVSETAAPRLDICRAIENKRQGLMLAKDAVVTASRFESRGNTMDGIRLEDQARGTFEKCELIDNVRSGLLAMEKSQFSITDSRIAQNGRYGVWVQEDVTGVVETCVVKGNKMEPWRVLKGSLLHRKDNQLE